MQRIWGFSRTWVNVFASCFNKTLPNFWIAFGLNRHSFGSHKSTSKYKWFCEICVRKKKQKKNKQIQSYAMQCLFTICLWNFVVWKYWRCRCLTTKHCLSYRLPGSLQLWGAKNELAHEKKDLMFFLFVILQMHMHSLLSGNRYAFFCLKLKVPTTCLRTANTLARLFLSLGLSCSKLTMFVVNVSLKLWLKLWSLNMAYMLIFLLKKFE